MKQKTQTQFVAIARKAMQLSAVGFASLSLLTSSADAQEPTPAFAPGSTFSPTVKSTGDEFWVPPATTVPSSAVKEVLPSSSEWSPPETLVKASRLEVSVEPNLPVATIQSIDIADELPVSASAELAPAIKNTPQILQDQIPIIADNFESFSAPELDLAPQVPEFGEGIGRSVMTPEPGVDPSLDSQQNLVSQADEVQFPSNDSVVASGIGAGNLVTDPQLRTPVRNLLGGVESRLAGKGGVHAVGQLTFLSLSRDYRGRGRQLSSGGPNLFANGPDEGDFLGVDVSYGQRRAGGRGWEMRYIGFNPDQETDVAGSNPDLVWGGITPPLNDPATWGGVIPAGIPETFGLSGIGFADVSMADLFDGAGNHRVSRDSEFGSFEFNLLRASAGGHRLSCGNATVEFFGGLRGVSFKETTTFTARALQTGFPRSAFYASEVQNSLFGLQIGGRLERQRQNGWSTSFGTRVGIYNNRVESRQRAQVQFDDGSTAVPQVLFGSDAGREFDFEGKDNELAFLGELDFGLIYQFRPRTRARFGYRGIAVTNIADSAGQFEDNLFDVDRVAEPRAFTDLIVGGFYFGVDHAF